MDSCRVIRNSDLEVITPKPVSRTPTSEHVSNGAPIPKVMRIRIFSDDDWEDFIEEWASGISCDYSSVRRFGGSGDFGVDIAGFCTEAGFESEWDNFQCKR